MAIVWTPPRTWTVGEAVTKAIMDSHLRDNLDFLRTPPSDRDLSNTAVSTTSTSMVDLTGASLSITTQGKNLIAFFSGTVSVAAGPVDEAARFQFDLDGTPSPALQQVRCLSTAGVADYKPVSFFYVFTGVSAAAHTVKVQWRSVGGAQVTLVLGGTTAWHFAAVEAWF